MSIKPAILFGVAVTAIVTIACSTTLTATSEPDDAVTETRPEYAEDGRRILYLTADQREHVSTEMRGFLMGISMISEAIADEDRTQIAEIASSMGRKGQGRGMGSGQGMGPGNGMGQGRGMGVGPGQGQGAGQGQGRGMGGIMANQPAEFHAIGRELRTGFDDIASMAATADMKDIQYALSANMNQCIACHGSFTARDAD